MTGQAIHGRRVEVHLMRVQPERGPRMVEPGQRRLHAIEVLALMLRMTGPARVHALNRAMNALFLRDLVGNSGMAGQT